ncbi:MAG: TIR domain-containing protein [Verrucomicrobia bacterium]|nr:TIR domain-containing protein [Verrucomicrobiota bacterium]
MNVERSAPRGAVFLSYASQDAEVARRICEALRTAGIEVWFDQSELVGGDAWDAKIRGQIASCALFVPIISANTQSRLEGYFRIEWKLAAQRTHAMAEAKPFLLPVVIDATRDAEAHVPGEFKSVQWTRLPAGETSDAFCARVRALIDGIPLDVGRGRPTPPPPGALAQTPGSGAPSLLQRSPLPALLWPVAALAVLGAIIFIWQRSAKTAPPPTPAAASASAPKSTPPPALTTPRLGPKSIAVLPFENLSEAKDDNAFFADGMHDDVINNLLLIRELRPIPRATMTTYRGTKKTPREIADELGVAHLLTGTVRRAGEKVKFTATLFNPRTDETLWNKPYDRVVTEIFAIQSELAQSIAAELKATLSSDEKKFIGRRPTENAAAYDLLLQARQLRHRSLNFAEIPKVESLLGAAIKLDPNFALAWGELSYAHGFAYIFNVDHTADRLAKAQQAIDTAHRLSPNDPEILLLTGYYRYFCHLDYDGADKIFAAVSRLQPSSSEPHHARGVLFRRQCRMREAAEAFQVASALDPLNSDSVGMAALANLAARRWEQATPLVLRRARLRGFPEAMELREAARLDFWVTGSTESLKRGVEKYPADSRRRWILESELTLAQGDYPNFVRLEAAVEVNGVVRDSFLRETSLFAQGKSAEARASAEAALPAIRQRLTREPENTKLWSRRAMAEAIGGHRDEAVRSARKAIDLRPETVDPWTAQISLSDLAFVHAWTGDRDSALQILERLLKAPSFAPLAGDAGTNAFLNVHVMRRHPYFFPLQGDPRFEALLKDPKNNAPLF